MKKKIKFEDASIKPPKAMMQLVDAFTDAYKPVPIEDCADEIFPVRRLRNFFQAWPVPKMPDPLPPYLNELEKRGYPMMTGYDGVPALFCVRWKARGEFCVPVETNEGAADSDIRTGMSSIRALIANRMSDRDDETDSEDEENEYDEDDEYD